MADKQSIRKGGRAVTASNGRAGDFAAFRPVRAGNAFEETVEQLLRAVKLGAVPPGHRLPPERELAAVLNVSRDTLREAIRVLAGEGIVESRRGRSGGTYVLKLPEPAETGGLRGAVAGLPGGLEDTLVFRRAVETGAAEAAAGRALEPEQRRLLTERQAAAEKAEQADYRLADTRFHLAVAELSGSSALTAAVGEARLRINDLLDAIPMLEVNLKHSAAQHERIVAAILGGDPDTARRAMAEHLEGTEVLLRGFLD
jgi:DNA-binding FadR family transcriptional regulator